MMLRLIYRAATAAYFALIHLAARFKPKARLWVEGRKDWRRRMPIAIPGERWIWMHCASLGEFEQGRPVIERLKAEYPQMRLLLTFFSPSGYEIRKDYPMADAVRYLPADTPANARDFIGALPILLAIFVKYEYWLFYLSELNRQNIPVILISAHIRPALFRGLQATYFRSVLRRYRHIFVQDESGRALLQKYLPGMQITVAGDTRFDRVKAIADAFEQLPLLEKFIGGRFCVVAGSTWTADERVLLDAKQLLAGHEIAWIIAPHEIHPERIQTLVETFAAVRYLELPTNRDADVLVIDNIGLLARIYHEAQACWIGGGFGAGIHNVLEASVYGPLVMIGPNYGAYREAVELVEVGAAMEIRTGAELAETLSKLKADAELRAEIKRKADAYMARNCGATEKIMAYLKPMLTSVR